MKKRYAKITYKAGSITMGSTYYTIITSEYQDDGKDQPTYRGYICRCDKYPDNRGGTGTFTLYDKVEFMSKEKFVAELI